MEQMKCWGCLGEGVTQVGEAIVAGESVGNYEECMMCSGTGVESGRFIAPQRAPYPETDGKDLPF